VTLLALLGPGSVPFAWIMFMTFMTQFDAMGNGYQNTGLGVLPALLTGAAVVVARFKALAAWLLWLISVVWILAVTPAAQMGDNPWPVSVPGLLTLLVVQFAAARDYRPLWSFAVWLGSLLLGFAIAFNGVLHQSEENLLLIGLLGLMAAVIGWSVRAIRKAQARVASEAQLTTEERARRRMLEERTRIARELHDVVAHHMSVIAVQAATAQYRLPDLPENARQELTSISEQARESLAELRRLLAVLRNEHDDAVREPQPGLDRIAALVDSVRRTGTEVELSMVADDRDVTAVPEAVSLTGYRITQEALSNVVRHAPGAPTRVDITLNADELSVDIVNGPPSSPNSSGIVGTGLGLAGMRERVKLLDGQLEAATTDGGGFAVRAVLPLTPSREPI